MSQKQASQPQSSAKQSNYAFGQAGGTSWEVTAHTKSFKCRIDGIPRPQARAFATTKGKGPKVRLWNPSKQQTDSFESCFKQALQSAQAENLFQKEGHPVKLSVKFYFSRPKKHYSYDGSDLKLSKNAPFYVPKKPDLDNLLKLVMDAIQGVCYANDCNVVHIDSAKLWNPCQLYYKSSQLVEGYTLIKVMEILDQTYTPGCTCLYCQHCAKKVHKTC